MRGISGKWNVVTGASSGIGRATAERLFAESSGVVLVARDAAKLADVRSPPGTPRLEVVADLTDPDAVRNLLTQLKSSVGPVHGWVLAAGAHGLRPMMLESVASLESLWKTNVGAVLGLLAAAIKARLVAPGGSIVLLSSVAVRSGGAGMVSYASTKGALEAAARSLALELAGRAIRVNVVAPGVVVTPMSDAYLARLNTTEQKRLADRHPLGLGQPTDVAGVIAFLLSDDARWVTGTTVTVDGGFSAG